jgi:hypothetical protein
MATGGQLQAYGYSITKADVYIPVPLPAGGGRLIPVGSHDKYFWYVRTVGGALQEVPRSDKGFAELMATMFADFPALAARVKAQENGADFKSMPQLLEEYNAHFARK